MADRFFANEMPDFIDETSNIPGATENSLLKLLALPYSSLSEKLKEKALGLKETIVRETWGHGGRRVQDFTVYTVCALRLFKIVILPPKTLGVCALGAVAAKHSGDERLLNHYLTQFEAVKDRNSHFRGAKFSFIEFVFLGNKILGAVVKEIIEEGRRLSNKGRCPLMYEWHRKKYWGAAHGLAGIVHVLMDMELKPDEVEDVKGTLRYMIQNRFPSGNYPSSEESESDRLVHWCHGSPGVALTLVKAAEVFGDEDFLRAAIDAGEVVWERGLLRRVGICHGVSGNAYVFLSLYRLTGNVKYLYRAKAFACFLLDKAEKLISEGKIHGGDHPYSLFEGLGGMAYFFLDMILPAQARFPGYEL
ncbi:hypothetical protein MKW98_029815 [Papaver atlanticum]|uniref:Uncharacterized protein n=1 Tax=Papaver atlanticum TaxID=357466 RepID=A0AAD4TGW8_9MAGN|nr:hypothetical protein MKW98_029815 [Papaver atlanticum]